jgi:hypothetical protein
VKALSETAKNIRAPFFFPGHKMGRSVVATGTQPRAHSSSPSKKKTRSAGRRGLAGQIPGYEGFFGADKLGTRSGIWQHDLPEIPELDNLFAPEASPRA